MHAQQQQLINGAWVAGDAASLSKHDPVSGQPLWQAATASAEQVDAAVKAARGAFPGWARKPLSLSASSYGHFTDAKNFWSQCHIFRFGNDRRSSRRGLLGG